MNKNQMAELLYALPYGVVVKGRKSKVVPLCLTLAGVVLLVVNGLLPATAGYEDLKSALVVFGGVSITPQMMKLRGGVDILVATPGRLCLEPQLFHFAVHRRFSQQLWIDRQPADVCPRAGRRV